MGLIPDKNISTDCKKIIEIIDTSFANAKELLDVAIQRAETAEKQLSQYQVNQIQKLKESYEAGVKAALNGSVSNPNPEGGPKLVHIQN